MRLPLDRPLPTRWFWTALVAVYVLSRIGTWLYPFDSDHWIFYYVGANWLHGGSLYVTAFDHKPPLIFLFNGLMSWAVGSSIVAHRAIFTLLSILDIYLFYRLCRRVAPRFQKVDAALFTQVALLVYVFWRDLSQFTGSANNDENIALPIVLAMLLAYLSFREDGKAWKLLGAGACLSFLFYFKPNFVLLGLPIVVLLAVAYRRQLGRLIGYYVLLGIPLVLQSVAWFAYFSARGTLHDFVLGAFLFSSKYASSAWAGDVSSISVRLVDLGVLVLLLAPVAALGYVFVKDRGVLRGDEAFWLVLLSAIASLFLTFDVGAFYPYYFLIAMPAFAIVMAYGVLNLRGLNRDLRQLIAFGVALCVAFSFVYSLKQAYNSFAGAVYADGAEYQQIAAYVDARTGPADKVFDYDYGATFYQLAGRGSGSRFVSASLLLLDYRDHYGFNLDQAFIEDMDRSQAKYVVMPRSQSNIYYANKPLVEYFSAHYQVEKEFPDYLVLRRT